MGLPHYKKCGATKDLKINRPRANRFITLDDGRQAADKDGGRT
jgi:hypothetical protein